MLARLFRFPARLLGMLARLSGVLARLFRFPARLYGILTRLRTIHFHRPSFNLPQQLAGRNFAIM